MGYLVLARKYRPQVFKDLVGQEDIALALKNAIVNKKIAHAYIFSGPRGVGKTSTARIFAKAVNCEHQETQNGEPCNDCSICHDISKGTFLDFVEIDGASNNGVEQIRNLRENVKYRPNKAQYKIYLIDEVHMLTVQAFNALLKTLEEPPEHIIFIFATTEPHKIPLTILSRCQRYDFKRIPTLRITEHLKSLLNKENVQYEEEAIFEIAKNADGSLRDSESLLDQLIAFSSGNIKLKDVQKLLGLVKTELFLQFFRAMAEKKREAGLTILQKIADQGLDFVQFFSGLVGFLRNLLIVKTLDKAPSLIIESTESEIQNMRELSDAVSEEKLIVWMDYLVDAINHLKFSAFPRVTSEIMFFKLINLSLNNQDLSLLSTNLNKLKDYAVVSRKMIRNNSAKIESGASMKSDAVIVGTQNFDKYKEAFYPADEVKKKTLKPDTSLTFEEKKNKIFNLWPKFLTKLAPGLPALIPSVCQINKIHDDKISIFILNSVFIKMLQIPKATRDFEKSFQNFFGFFLNCEFIYKEREKKNDAKSKIAYEDLYKKAQKIFGGRYLS